MKRLFLALLLVSMTSYAQSCISFGKKEYGTVSLFVDPVGSINEGGLDIGGDLELVSYWGYVKAGFQSFDALEGGYLDTVGGAGFNFATFPFDYFRFYTGIRLGLVHRGLASEDRNITYPLYGWEGGIDYNINDNWYIGVSGIVDWREDFKFSGAEPEFQWSGRGKLGYKFDVK